MKENWQARLRSSLGGSRGIGAAIAERLAVDGASVAVTYSKGADAAASVVKAIERAGGKAVAIQADAADGVRIGPEQHERALAGALQAAAELAAA